MSIVKAPPKVKLGTQEFPLTFDIGALIRLASSGVDALSIFNKNREGLFLRILPILVPMLTEGIRDEDGKLPPGITELEIKSLVEKSHWTLLPQFVQAITAALTAAAVDPEAEEPANPPIQQVPAPASH